jgi:lysophospholipase L1-like esterase
VISGHGGQYRRAVLNPAYLRKNIKMKTLLLTLLSLLFSITAYMQTKSLSYLALGDSYTIGESVSLKKNFPNQTAALLRAEGFAINEPTIIAKTGWTTDELQNQLAQTRLQIPFDFVSLLIGVNNQYRGRSTDEYAKQFEVLLQQAIGYAGGNTNHVIVLSIPDWGVTPFAEGRDRMKISKEIDLYNTINERISKQHKVHYINITAFTREAVVDKTLVAKDGLHPSAKDYARWAVKVKEVMIKELK